MSNVVRKRKRTLLSRIINKVKGDTSVSEQREVLEFDNTQTNTDEVAAIAKRRSELKAARHENSDVTVSNNIN